MLFAAVALTGVLAAVGMQTLTGPVTTITRVTQRNVADNNLLMDAKILVNAAVGGVSGGDDDSDGIIEPAAFIPATGGETPPANGGFLPIDLGLALTDPWGRKYGYCVWDHGTTNTSANRLTGDNTASASTQAVIALIAAGPDKTFQTTCSAYSGGAVQVTKAGGSDDIVFKYNYAEATASSNGLWSINTSDQTKAELKDSAGSAVNVSINRDTGIGDFLGLTTSVISAKTGETIALDGGLLLDAAGTSADTCTAAEKGALRLTTDKDDLELCDGAGGWAQVKTPPGGSTGHVQFNDGAGGFGGDANLFWDDTNKRLGIGTATPAKKLDVVGNAGISGDTTVGGTLGATGATTLSSTLGVTGATTLSSTLDVTGNATFDTSTLFVDAANDRVGVGNTAPAHVLDITGATDMGTLGSFVVGDAAAHIDDGTANLYMDGRAVISDSGLILGTTGTASLQLVTDQTQRFLIAADGTVSIAGNTGIGGATTLAGALSVAGNAAFDTDTLFVDAAVNAVGVGTALPAAKLDVAGGVKIGADAVCNASKAGMAAWNSNQLQICDGTAFKNISAIDRLDDIGDVDVPTPNNNDVVAWNSTDSKWEAKNIALLGPAQVNVAGNDGDIQFRDGSDLGADSLLHWDNTNKRLGIGTASPTSKLSIDTGANRTINFWSSVNYNVLSMNADLTTAGHTGLVGGATGDDSLYINAGNAGDLIFRTAGTSEKMRILSNGNVGIGTASPQSLLQVAGGIQLGDDTATCPGASDVKLGTLRFNSGALQVCKASGWSAVGSGSSSTTPAFSVYRAGGQTAGVNIVLDMDTKSFDTTSAYNLTTDRFTPTVAGKYFFRSSVWCASGAICQALIYKNGANQVYAQAAPAGDRSYATIILDMNGTTDYVQAVGYSSGGAGDTFNGGIHGSTFSGFLIGGGSDTLAGLSCASGEITKWNGTAWACAADGGGSGGSGFGSWVGSNSFGTNYQAATDGFVVARVNTNGGGRCYAFGYSDSTSTPSTLVASAMGQETGSGDRVMTNSFTMPVKKNDYWRAAYTAEAGTCSTSLYWIPDTGGGSGAPGGANSQVQFNDAGVFGGAAQLFWDKANNRLGVNVASPTQAVDVTGAVTSDRMIFKSVSSAAAPVSGSTYWSSDGTNAWRASGNVGIGTTSPGGKLHVNAAADTYALRTSGGNLETYLLHGSSNGVWYTNASGGFIINNQSGSLAFAASNAEVMRITGGNVGIGTASPGARLAVAGNSGTGVHVHLQPTLSSPGQGIQMDTAGLPNGSNGIFVNAPSGWTGNIIKSNLNGVEKFFINQAGAASFSGGVTSGGNAGVAYQVTQAANQHGLISTASTSGYYAIYNQALAAGSYAAGFYTQANNSTGCTLAYGATAWSCFSDWRLKKNVETIPDALGKLALLRGVTFNTLEQKRGDKKHLGVIAQDVLKVFPEAVSAIKAPGSEESHYSVEYTALIGPIISGMNELKGLFDDLAAKVAELVERVTGYDKAIAALQAENDALKAELEALRKEDKERQKIDASMLKRLEALEAHVMH